MFDHATRRRLLGVLAGSVLLAMLEVAGIGLLVLLVEQLTSTGEPSGALERISNLAGDPSPQQMLVILAGSVLTVFLLKAVFALAFRRWVLRFLAIQETETSHRLLVGYLTGPYSRVVQRKTSDLIATLTDYTSAAYGLVVSTVLAAATEVLTILAILALLLWSMPVPTIGALVFFGGSALLLGRLLRERAARSGEAQASAGGRAWRATVHSLGGSKELRVRGTTSHFIDEYRSARRDWAEARASAAFMGEAPKYVLEVIFIAGILVIIGLVSVLSEPGRTVPMVALFAVAGLRLLPSTVRILASVTAVRTGTAQLRLVVQDLLEALPETQRWLAGGSSTDDELLTLDAGLEIRAVHFRYPAAESDVLEGVQVTVPAGSSVALVGTSGAGKSTLIDILLGLQAPTSGEVLADGISIHTTPTAWQRRVGYVAQDVFLLDASLRENVTLGLSVDDEVVRRCLRRAQLADLLESLPEGLETPLGDRGSRLSGGQRQRLGIARALCVDPAILFLDEATSALDNETERRVTEALRELQGEVTTVVVAHRLSTVRNCDQIILLEGGRVAGQGGFEELVRSNAQFARLVELGRL